MTLDGRHRWVSVDEGGRIVHTCRVCGRQVVYEKFLPDAYIDAVLALNTRPNVYRDILRR